MLRRTFNCWLALLGMTAGLQSSARATSHQATETKNRSVLVIGAGIAGLAAARKLKSAGYSVTIIEARDRIGGRIWTSTYWPDTPLDLGASWIHGEQGNPLTDLANSIAAERVATHYEVAQAYNTNGHPLTQGEEARLETLKDSLFDAISEAQAGETDQTIRDVATNWATERNANAETRRWINFILSGSIEQEYAGSAESLSGFWFDGSKTYPGDDALFVEGFRVIVDHLSKGLDIRLGEVVKEISWQTHPIAVVTDRQEFSADYVLVTLPLGVLKTAAVTFSPALPVKKQNAIRALAMGVLNKCYLRFEKAFWPQDVDWLEYIPAKHGAWTEWVSFMRTTNQPILLGFNAADYGRQIENWSGEAIVADAMSTLRTIYGRDVPEPIDYQITRWAKDPYALGSYSYNPVGSHPRQRKHLARPEGRMFFAGEATEENYFASAHGAYMSGLRAAAEIMQA